MTRHALTSINRFISSTLHARLLLYVYECQHRNFWSAFIDLDGARQQMQELTGYALRRFAAAIPDLSCMQQLYDEDAGSNHGLTGQASWRRSAFTCGPPFFITGKVPDRALPRKIIYVNLPGTAQN